MIRFVIVIVVVIVVVVPGESKASEEGTSRDEGRPVSSAAEGGGCGCNTKLSRQKRKEESMSSTPTGWSGEPRVIYHDVSDSIQQLRSTRIAARLAKRQGESLDKFSSNSGGDSGGGGGIGSSKSNQYGGSGGASSSGSSQQRFVTFLYDLPASYDKNAGDRLPEISIVNANGEERRKHFSDRELGPLDAGSVIVLREAGRGTGIAAYFVGEEEHQVPSYSSTRHPVRNDITAVLLHLGVELTGCIL